MKYLPQATAIIIFGLVGGAFYLLYSAAQNKTAASGVSTPIPVRVAQVRHVSLPSELQLSGELVAVKQAEVVSRLAGRVTEVRVQRGDFLTAGTIIATIRASDLDYRLRVLEAELKAAKENLAPKEISLTESEHQVAQTRDLLRRDLIARRDLEQSESAAETARAQVELARARVAQQQAMLDQARALQKLTKVSAPFSGEVAGVLTKPGATIAEGGKVLSIISLETLKLVAKIDGRIFLRRGMKALVATSDLFDTVAEGHVVRFERGEASEGTNELEIHVKNWKRSLRPGMKVTASIDLAGKEDVLLIPRSAVFSENKTDYVYKLSAGQAVRHAVMLGPRRGEEISIARGLKGGESVVVDYKTIHPGAGSAAVPLGNE